MSISPISQNFSTPYQNQKTIEQKKQLSFGQNKQEYGNPVNKGMEYYGAAIGSGVLSTGVGVGTGLIAKMDGVKKAIPILDKKHGALVTGIIAGLGTAALTLPSALYHRSVNVFAKEKEFDVYSRSKSAETSLSEQIDQQARDPEVPLEQSVDNFAKFNIARKGNGVGVFGV